MVSPSASSAVASSWTPRALASSDAVGHQLEDAVVPGRLQLYDAQPGQRVEHRQRCSGRGRSRARPARRRRAAAARRPRQTTHSTPSTGPDRVGESLRRHSGDDHGTSSGQQAATGRPAHRWRAPARRPRRRSRRAHRSPARSRCRRRARRRPAAYPACGARPRPPAPRRTAAPGPRPSAPGARSASTARKCFTSSRVCSRLRGSAASAVPHVGGRRGTESGGHDPIESSRPSLGREVGVGLRTIE